MGHTDVDPNRKLEVISKSTSLHHAGATLRGKAAGLPGSSQPLCTPGQ